MEFTTVPFFAYNIRSTVLSGVKMYLVSDLLNQYNAVHQTNKQFYKYLQNQETKELLQNRSVYTRPPNSVVVESAENDTNHWDIEGIIKYVTFNKTFGTASQGYVICEELLIACLMWADPSFAWDVYTFLKNCREKDNDFLKKKIIEMRDRYIPNNQDSQWSYIFSIKEEDGNIILRSKYVHQSLKGYFIDDNMIYVKNLPNGYIFKKNAYDNLLPVIQQYGGRPATSTIQLEDDVDPIIRINKSKFIIPKKTWDKDHKYFKRDVCLALQKTRQDLCWRNDIELDADLE